MYACMVRVWCARVAGVCLRVRAREHLPRWSRLVACVTHFGWIPWVRPRYVFESCGNCSRRECRERGRLEGDATVQRGSGEVKQRYLLSSVSSSFSGGVASMCIKCVDRSSDEGGRRCGALLKTLFGGRSRKRTMKSIRNQLGRNCSARPSPRTELN